MKMVLLQYPDSTAESRLIRMASMLMDDVECKHSTLQGLVDHKHKLRCGAMPVGSVEFVRAAMEVAGIPEPQNMSYPEAAREYLCRTVTRMKAGEVVGMGFVKPVKTKQFTGFVFDMSKYPGEMEAHDVEQYDAFMAISPQEEVWLSEPVSFASEWRYYVLRGEIIGQARYDPDGLENAAIPDVGVVRSCISDLGLTQPYAIDFGVLSDGRTALVELNDAWAIGLYSRALEPAVYYEFLRARWDLFIEELASVAQS